jgi:hypothetical protein
MKSPEGETAMSDRSTRYINFAMAILLSLSALGTSWAGYQATLWSGDQSVFGGQSIAMRHKSTRASTAAGQLRTVDVLVFMNWLAAYGRGDTVLAEFYERRFRAEFRPAFRAWVASRPLRSPDAAPTPFALPEYELSDDDDAVRFEAAADSLALKGAMANRMSDAYVLDAVILATVMFFASAAQQATDNRLRVMLGIIAVVICGTGILRFIVLPRA